MASGVDVCSGPAGRARTRPRGGGDDGRSGGVSRHPGHRQPQHRVGHRPAPFAVGGFRPRRAYLRLALRNRRLEKRREAVRQAGQRVYETADLLLRDDRTLRRNPVVPVDRVLSQTHELSDRYLFPLLRLLLHPLPARDGHALSLLVWLGRDAGWREKDLSHFSRASC